MMIDVVITMQVETCCKPDNGSEKEDEKKDADRQGKDQHLGEQVHFNLADSGGWSLILK